MALPTPPVPPTPEQIVNAASNEISNVVNTVVQQLAPVGDAAQNASNSIAQAGNAFTQAVTQSLGSIQAAINQAVTEINKQEGNSLNAIHNLLTNIPDINLPSLIKINGQDIEANPDILYTTMRNFLNKSDAIEIDFYGPLAAPLRPLAGADHDRLRAIVLPAIHLPLDSAVLNSDPITITALIIIAIIILGLPLTVAVGIAIGAIFIALAAVLIIAAAQGREISVDTCPEVDIGGSVPGIPDVIKLNTGLCTKINISGPIQKT